MIATEANLNTPKCLSDDIDQETNALSTSGHLSASVDSLNNEMPSSKETVEGGSNTATSIIPTEGLSLRGQRWGDIEDSSDDECDIIARQRPVLATPDIAKSHSSNADISKNRQDSYQFRQDSSSFSSNFQRSTSYVDRGQSRKGKGKGKGKGKEGNNVYGNTRDYYGKEYGYGNEKYGSDNYRGNYNNNSKRYNNNQQQEQETTEDGWTTVKSAAAPASNNYRQSGWNSNRGWRNEQSASVYKNFNSAGLLDRTAGSKNNDGTTISYSTHSDEPEEKDLEASASSFDAAAASTDAAASDPVAKETEDIGSLAKTDSSRKGEGKKGEGKGARKFQREASDNFKKGDGKGKKGEGKSDGKGRGLGKVEKKEKPVKPPRMLHAAPKEDAPLLSKTAFGGLGFSSDEKDESDRGEEEEEDVEEQEEEEVVTAAEEVTAEEEEQLEAEKAEEKTENVEKKTEAKEQGSSGKKKKNKGKTQDDEDLDKLMAEFALDVVEESKSAKKKKNKKK